MAFCNFFFLFGAGVGVSYAFICTGNVPCSPICFQRQMLPFLSHIKKGPSHLKENWGSLNQLSDGPHPAATKAHLLHTALHAATPQAGKAIFSHHRRTLSFRLLNMRLSLIFFLKEKSPTKQKPPAICQVRGLEKWSPTLISRWWLTAP